MRPIRLGGHMVNFYVNVDNVFDQGPPQDFPSTGQL